MRFWLLGASGLLSLTLAGCDVDNIQVVPVAPPGAVYQGDRYNPSGAPTYYYPSSAYATQSNAYPSTTGYYYSNGDYYRNYRGIHSPDERNM